MENLEDMEKTIENVINGLSDDEKNLKITLSSDEETNKLLITIDNILKDGLPFNKCF
jgi:hypothetical protein